MPTFPAAEFAPDRAELDPSASNVIKNVIPNSNGYGPLKGLSVYSAALASACRGAFYCKSRDGANHVFSSTATGLFKLQAAGTWDDVSRTAGGAYSLAAEHWWSFDIFGNVVRAAQTADVTQAYTIGVSTDFAALAGSPPQAKIVFNESGYAGAANASSAESTIYRSAYETITSWTLGLSGADAQAIPTGGGIQAVVPNEGGAIIFQEREIRQLVNIPAQEVGFGLQVVEKERGTPSALSVVPVGPMIFFYADDGFFQLGAPSDPIGFEKIDQYFHEDVADPAMVQGAYDPRRKMVWWRYKSAPDLTYTDKLIGYWWPGKKWCYAEINLEWIMTLATAGVTLEELDSVLGLTNIDTITQSLDSAAFLGGRPAFGAFNTDHKFGFFEGDELEATLETADIPTGGEGKRGYVNGFRPLGDATGVYGQVITQGTLGGSRTTHAEALQNSSTGLIPARADGRTHRFRVRIPAATDWSHFLGIEVPTENMRSTGRR